jgi:hypothetical protein
MTAEKVQRLVVLTTQLAETLLTAAICANEIRVIVRAELDGQVVRGRGRPPDERPRDSPRPLVDDSTFSVLWAGRVCSLPTVQPSKIRRSWPS